MDKALTPEQNGQKLQLFVELPPLHEQSSHTSNTQKLTTFLLTAQSPRGAGGSAGHCPYPNSGLCPLSLNPNYVDELSSFISDNSIKVIPWVLQPKMGVPPATDLH
ncbi:hypothetical protein TNIN_473511 [Trichonephila inaurata madagascariensis]|uniref:Uncharacterized protein n=1 Tax=Trichonephila inaurata madagascariensis TaxID=2747483 RepID=A0A8X6YY02_9ARAC|nr:hypothetical protein TNIN_473511 [Trichonephila inaurata madagascariensis]